MAVYFIADDEEEDHQQLRVKIGLSRNIQSRIRQLQTGSPYRLRLMGWIESDDDASLERHLHAKYASQNTHHEWFHLEPYTVLKELKSHGISAYIAVLNNAFEVTAYDKDGIPEYVGAWKWTEVEDIEFCPQCGCCCGLHYNENYGTERCLKCGIIDAHLERL